MGFDASAFGAAALVWAQQNPLLVFLVAFVFWQLWHRSAPFPEVTGSKVREIRSQEQFAELLGECKKNNSVLVVDFFALWCPPCRRAHPIYAEMSKFYQEKDAIFAKVNVDEARAVAAAQGIQAMPTFKVYDASGRVLSTLQGWNESTLRDNIVKAINK
jgi:thioredoxin 1